LIFETKDRNGDGDFFFFLKVYAKAGMRLGMTIINLNDTTVETPKVEGVFEGFL
jgi:hypothetical protein